MSDENYFFNWSVGWVRDSLLPTWRLTLEHDEFQGVSVTTHVDVLPNPALVEHCRKRELELGLIGMLELFVQEVAWIAASEVRYQLLTDNRAAVNEVTVDLKRGFGAHVSITSTRVPTSMEQDTVAYLKAVGQVIEELRQRMSAETSEEVKQRFKEFSRAQLNDLEERRPKREILDVRLSDSDSIGLYVDEYGDPGFSKGSPLYFVVGAVTIRDSRADTVRSELTRIISELAPKGVRELKFGKIDKYPPKFRKPLYQAVVEVVLRHVEEAMCIAVSKHGFVGEKIRVAMSEYFFGHGDLPAIEEISSPENFDVYSRELYAQWSSQFLVIPLALIMAREGLRGHVVYDKTHKLTRNEVIETSFREANEILPGILAMEGVRLNDHTIPLRLEHSTNEPMLWLAELYAREVAKRLQGQESLIDELAEKLPQTRGMPGRYVALVSPRGKYGYYDVLSGETHLELPD